MTVRKEEEIRRNPDQKRSKFSIFAGDMILYIENTKDATRKLLELINAFSKVVGYKINTQKCLTFLYTNNEKLEREIKESILFTIVTKRKKKNPNWQIRSKTVTDCRCHDTIHRKSKRCHQKITRNNQ